MTAPADEGPLGIGTAMRSASFTCHLPSSVASIPVSSLVISSGEWPVSVSQIRTPPPPPDSDSGV